MRTKISIIFLSFLIIVNAQQQKPPIDYVNVFTDTSNSRWMLFPGATLPFGMVKLNPDTEGNVWNGGYEYTVSCPLFNKITIHLDPNYYKGNTFTIEAKNNSEKIIYIQSAKLHGNNMDKPILSHKDLMNGGKLIFEMGPMPNKNWGSKKD